MAKIQPHAFVSNKADGFCSTCEAPRNHKAHNQEPPEDPHRFTVPTIAEQLRNAKPGDVIYCSPWQGGSVVKREFYWSGSAGSGSVEIPAGSGYALISGPAIRFYDAGGDKIDESSMVSTSETPTPDVADPELQPVASDPPAAPLVRSIDVEPVSPDYCAKANIHLQALHPSQYRVMLACCLPGGHDGGCQYVDPLPDYKSFHAIVARLLDRMIYAPGIYRIALAEGEPELQPISEGVKSTYSTYERRQTIDHGVYRISWKSGGSSVGVIGSQSNGERWIACANWINAPNTFDRQQEIWDDIADLTLLAKD